MVPDFALIHQKVPIMAQILDPIPTNCSHHILCCYANTTSKMQIARIANIDNWYFERVVFPGQRLVFEAPPEAILEIHKGSIASAIVADRIPCVSLQVQETPPPNSKELILC